MKEGPLCKEQMRDCKFIFTHFVPHEDTAHRGLSQLGPASRRACMGALLTAGTAVLEPTLAIEVRVPTDLVGNVASVGSKTAVPAVNNAPIHALRDAGPN